MSIETDTDKLRRRNRELSILNTIAEALNREVDLGRALGTALAQVAALLDLHTGWIWLHHDKRSGFYLAAAHNLPPALADFPQRMEGSCYCLDTFAEGGLSGAANVVRCSRLKWLTAGTAGLSHHASIPLHARGEPLGVLNVASPDWRELSPNTLRLLHTVGDLLAIAIQRARLFEQRAQLGAVEERNRLARELHDTLAQTLTAITLQLETADALLESGASERGRANVLRALELTRASLEETRRSVLDLRAAPLEGRTLGEALTSLVATSAEEGGFVAQLQVEGEPHRLPLRVEVGLYRIAQEGLRNIARHAAARHVSVRLFTHAAEVELRIEDDGCGFDPAGVAAGHFGLVGLNERARLLGGRLTLCSDEGQGTQLRVVVPLSQG